MKKRLIITILLTTAALAVNTYAYNYPSNYPVKTSPFKKLNGVNFAVDSNEAKALNKISNNFSLMRLYSFDSTALNHAINSGMDIILGTSNSVVTNNLQTTTGAKNYLNQINPYINNIKCIILGNEPFNNNISSQQLSTAMSNLRKVLGNDNIPITVNLAYNTVGGYYGQGQFNTNLNIGTLLNAIDYNNKKFPVIFVDLYPYEDMVNNGYTTPLSTALNSNMQLNDDYLNFGEAMTKAGYPNQKISVYVGETGWPTDGGSRGLSTATNANTYINDNANGVIAWSKLNKVPTMLFAAVDQPSKPGPAYEKRFGLYDSSINNKPGLTIPFCK